MRGYDNWKLASPYEGRDLPSRAENALGTRYFHPEMDEHLTLDYAYVETDEDEDGKHDAVVYGVVYDSGYKDEIDEYDLELVTEPAR